MGSETGYSQCAVKLCISHGCEGLLYICCLTNGGVDLGQVRCVRISGYMRGRIQYLTIAIALQFINFDSTHKKTRIDYTTVWLPTFIFIFCILWRSLIPYPAYEIVPLSTRSSWRRQAIVGSSGGWQVMEKIRDMR